MEIQRITPPLLCLWRIPKVVERLKKDFEAAESIRGHSAWALRTGRLEVPGLRIGGVLAYRPEDVVRYSIARRSEVPRDRGPRLFDAEIKPPDRKHPPLGYFDHVDTPRARAAGEVERLLSDEALGAEHLLGCIIRSDAASLQPIGDARRLGKGRLLIPMRIGRLRGLELIALLRATVESLKERAAEAQVLARRTLWTTVQISKSLGVSARWLRTPTGRAAVPPYKLSSSGTRYRREALLTALRGPDKNAPPVGERLVSLRALAWVERAAENERLVEARLKALQTAISVLESTVHTREAYARFEVPDTAIEVRFTHEAVIALLAQIRQTVT
jgi:hypothetical protein